MALFGSYTPGNTLETKHAIEGKLGRKLDACYLGAPWYSDGRLNAFPAGAVNTIAGEGATVLLHHQPWNLQNQLNDPEWRLRRVLERLNDGGDLSLYLRQYAREMKASGKPIIYRMACEFNGAYPQYNTSPQNKALGITPADFVNLHKRVTDTIKGEGAKNVTFAWNPNYFFPGDVNNSVDPAPYYPGDAYVDVVGIDGYPWKGATPETIFDPIVAACRKIAPSKPLWIMETNGYGQEDEGIWAAKVMPYAEAKQLDGVVWFSDTQTANPATNAGLAAALKATLARPYWQGAATVPATPPPIGATATPKASATATATAPPAATPPPGGIPPLAPMPTDGQTAPLLRALVDAITGLDARARAKGY